MLKRLGIGELSVELLVSGISAIRVLGSVYGFEGAFEHSLGVLVTSKI